MVKDYKTKFPNFKFFRKNFSSTKPVYFRSGFISQEIVGQKFMVHNGNAFRSVLPKFEMVSQPLGDYVFTKITGQSIHKRKRKKKEKKKRGRK
ncbi:MAG: ribosomal protein S19 family protein [Pseudomonadota bacterium]|jgi:ribosomal protein S19|nr:ribosomal protein S19 family protein [Bacteroidota bacterium]MCA6444744.1 ribosomal protein S19 family protein [Bacteroidota bacterium]